ncbi:F0F1 ATP synthase subunit delta [Halopseudomonas laoshanensis]|uniref:ATP synthase subunit delta n=1 Tax=Halopseudomonas laoshanensis TaxID=2268758 RepID=A0A7V7GSN3_9GAMM|nr:F0F1 ATP synthase subunit delta [Halopseudomonas laoshanensis]KAA0694039.1 F0F1 ATP synthase subunit delta [Halopseudomonas laoshanensis]
MATINTLARPYAKAAFEHASAAGGLDAWSGMLTLAAAAVQDDAFAARMRNPGLTEERKADDLLMVCEGHVDEAFGNFIRTLSEHDRLPLIPVIAELYEQHKAEHDRSVAVEVESAFELSDDQQKTLATALSKRLDRTVTPHVTINPALIGGVLIRAGDLVIDGSVRGKLDKLAEALKS